MAKRDALFGYLFVAPQTIGYLLFILGPLIAIFVFSTQERNIITGQAKPVGLANYAMAFENDPVFPEVVRNSLTFASLLVPFNLALALFLALLLTQPIRGATFFRAVFFAPVVTSAVAWAIVWRFTLQGEQGLNQFLALVGIDGPNWLREPVWAMLSVVVTRVFKTVGLNMLIFIAALQNIPREYTEAATVDGASLWERVRHVTIPLLSPTILLVLVITIIGSLQIFDHIMLMTNGGPSNATMVLIFYIYYQAFKIFDIGYASALSVVLFLIVLTATVIQWVLRRRFVYSED